MHLHFHDELRSVKERLLEMGALAERNVHRAVDVLTMRDAGAAALIFETEAGVNNLQLEVDDRVIDLIARRQPVGGDLRFLLCASRIASDIERIGDHATSIAESTLRLIEQEPLDHVAIMHTMAEQAMAMLRKALESFVKGDAVLAREVLLADDSVDALRDQAFRDRLNRMTEDPRNISRGFSQILVARNLERIADHATNIAEDVIYLVEGREVRHHRELDVGWVNPGEGGGSPPEEVRK